MYRVLIADYDTDFAELLRKQIGNGFSVEACCDSESLLDLIDSFDPNVIVMDAFLSGVDGWGTLQMLSDTGRMPQVIITSRNCNPYILNRFAQMGVTNLFVKPCRISAVAASVNQLCTLQETIPNGTWCVENEIDNILLRLGFQMGTKGYNAVYEAVLLRYESPDATVTKHIYPRIARNYGVDARCLEKRIRDTIRAAFACDDIIVWKCFFKPDANGVLTCPSNDLFIGRIAGGLHQRARVKPPYKFYKQKKA